MSYETEEQQVEAIKKWWKENGTMFVAGIVITLGAVVGWRWWMDHRNAQAEAAAVEYQQLLAELSQGDKEAVIKRGGYLIDNYAATPYSDLAALALSRLRVDAGELAAARSRLEWVMNHAEAPELRDVARLRLARVHLAAGNTRQRAPARDCLTALPGPWRMTRRRVYCTSMRRRLAFSTLGTVSSRIPSLKLALAPSAFTSAGRATVREKVPRLISRR